MLLRKCWVCQSKFHIHGGGSINHSFTTTKHVQKAHILAPPHHFPRLLQPCLLTTYILEVWSYSALVRTLLIAWQTCAGLRSWFASNPLFCCRFVGGKFLPSRELSWHTNSWCLDNQFWVLKCAQHNYNLVLFGEYLDVISLVRSWGRWGLNPGFRNFLMRTAMWQLSYVCERFSDRLAFFEHNGSLYILQRGSWQALSRIQSNGDFLEAVQLISSW